MPAGHLDIAQELAGNRAGLGQRSRERNLAHPDIQVRTDLSQVGPPGRRRARISGIQALLVITGEAAAPTGAAALRSATGTYLLVFTAVAACSLAAALLFLARSAQPSAGPGIEISRPGQ